MGLGHSPFTVLGRHIAFLSRYIGRAFLALILLTILIWIFDSLSISFFVPLLQTATQAEPTDSIYYRLLYGLLDLLRLDATLGPLLFCIALLTCLKALGTFLATVTNAYIRNTLARDLRLDIVRRYATMEYAHYLRMPSGYINNIITTEVDRIVSSFTSLHKVMDFVIQILIFSAMACLLNWRLFLCVIAIAALFFFLFRRLAKRLHELSLSISRDNASVQSSLLQIIYSYKYLKATGRFRALLDVLQRDLSARCNKYIRAIAIVASPEIVAQVVSVILFTSFIAYLVGHAGHPLGIVMVSALFMYKTLVKLLGINKLWQGFHMHSGGLFVVTEANAVIDAHQEQGGQVSVTGIRRGISLRDVSFSYDDSQVLAEVTLEIPLNTTLGIVGVSGAGKTTLVNLIAGILAPSRGEVWLDDQPYQALEIESLRRLFGYVAQEPVTFADSLAKNISFWAEDGEPPSERLRAAAEAAHCLEFIAASERGFATSVGDTGLTLSGGQRQRLAIAREIYKDPAVLIFDEATSSLDSSSEQQIRASLESMAGARTLIIIAHRLATLRACDQIVVLREGRIAERGTWDELLAQPDSLFTAMCQMQEIDTSSSR